MMDVISADNVKMCSTNRAIRPVSYTHLSDRQADAAQTIHQRIPCVPGFPAMNSICCSTAMKVRMKSARYSPICGNSCTSSRFRFRMARYCTCLLYTSSSHKRAAPSDDLPEAQIHSPVQRPARTARCHCSL